MRSFYLCGVMRAIAAWILLLAMLSSAKAQQVFAANHGNGSITKISQGGAVETFVSGLSGPVGLARDNSGNLYTTDSGSGSILKISPLGVATPFVTGISSVAQGLAFDSSGDLYVADYGTNSILRVTPGGVVSNFATVTTPVGLAFDTDGNLFASGGGNTFDILKITPGGVVSVFASDRSLNGVFGLAFDSAGFLYSANAADGTISKINGSGVPSLFATGLSTPYGLLFDGSGNLLVGNYGDGRILSVSPGGTVTTFASGLSEPTFLVSGSSTSAPEPASVALLSLGIGGCLLLVRRR